MIMPSYVFLIVILSAGLFLLLEYFFPRQEFSPVKGWRWRALSIILIQITFSFMTGSYIDPIIRKFSFFHVNGNAYFKVGLGYFIISFVFYWWHRLRHTRYFWEIFHQLHHSPSRLEILTTFYKHPVEIFVDNILSSIILYLMLGLSPTLGASVVCITGVAELFYHANIRTPYWLGYFFQRPESHCMHHKLGIHHYNYSDLPIWDMLFGTFYNPTESSFKCGFSGEKELQLKDILCFKNLNKSY
jgi:sterol desaturase/sphingolipid hydroxylase (fatty acid hydroxylase superfamily)